MVENQDARKEDQNFDIDIIKVYQNFILEIDSLRSTKDKNLKESRCHAFYRLLGLPVSDGNEMYSPGFDKPNNNDTSTNNKKTRIATSINKKMLSLMNDRENEPRKYLSIFSLQDVNATLLAVSSVEPRLFSASFLKSTDFFDTNKDNQSYVIETVNRLYTEIQDTSSARATNILPTRYHFLKPLLVNSEIDNNVTPAKNRIAVPFLKSKSETKLNDNDYLKRPFIEKICRDRFNASSQTQNSGTYITDIINSIKNNSQINNSILIKSLNPSSIEQIQFTNNLNIIRSMLGKLSKAIDDVNSVLNADPNNKNQPDYNWYPIPDKFGPEIGASTRELDQQIDNPHNTKKEKNLLDVQFQELIDDINNKFSQQTKVDLGGFAFDNSSFTPDVNSSDSLGNNKNSSLQYGLKTRQEICEKANEGLKQIEIIMGEFSGLGLCDILAITTALWIVDRDVLLNLLDDTAVTRMQEDKSLKVDAFTRNVPDSLQKFETKVKEIFELMDKLYQDIRSQNAGFLKH